MDESPNLMELGSLQDLIQENSFAKLEKGVKTGLKIVDEVATALAKVLADKEVAVANAEAVAKITRWIESIDLLRSKADRQRAVVGVVGATGAGKSSIINAVLDEEFLVPTNCVEACTAVSTELSYNSSDDENEKYRAEIHFISADEWTKGLNILLDDLRCGGGQLNADRLRHDTEAAIACAKIRSVYPALEESKLTSKTLTAEALAEHPSVRRVLDTVLRISAPTCRDLSQRLEPFIKPRKKEPSRRKNPSAIEYWPLIKVVKIFAKSAVLESGLVLVDLPGIHDSNAARSAVASKYIEQCTDLWVVSTIQRAVDDEAAHTLLSKSFRRQLQFDSMYSNITVICSKTDDLPVTECLTKIPAENEAHRIQSQRQHVPTERNQLQEELDKVSERVVELGRIVEDRTAKIVNLVTAMSCSSDEGGVLLSSPLKRMALATNLSPRKRVRSDHDSDLEESDRGGENEMATSVHDTETQEYVTKEEVTGRLAAITKQQQVIQQEKSKPETEQKQLRENIRACKAKEKALDSQLKSACIKYRNNYARPVIQRKFAEGLKELDQGTQDEASFDPKIMARDYSEVANKLPVFCVSAKAYHKMSGRLKRDEDISGFPLVDDTEIPALKNHALGIVQSARQAACGRFLDDLKHFLQKLYLQVIIDETLNMGDDFRQLELEFLQESIEILKSDCDAAIQRTLADCRRIANATLFSAQVAANNAMSTVAVWGGPRDQGGLVYQSYRAACSRGGEFKSPLRPLIDFNQDLIDPFMAHVSGCWESSFINRIPAHLEKLRSSLDAALSAFRRRMASRSRMSKLRSFRLVDSQMRHHHAVLGDTRSQKKLVRDGQQDARKILHSTVRSNMAPTYSVCARESGPGCFKRMKDHMFARVEAHGAYMFQAVAFRTKNALNNTLGKLEKKIQKRTYRVTDDINDAFTSMLTDRNLFKNIENIRKEVGELLTQADRRFEQTLRPSPLPANLDTADQLAAMKMDDGPSSRSPQEETSAELRAGGPVTPAAAIPHDEASTAMAAAHDVLMRDA
ncbi:hypothetical protein VTK56DRAFT_3907 [Thermocarpiscus australiensis]